MLTSNILCRPCGSSTQWESFLCLPNASIKDMHHHSRLTILFYLCLVSNIQAPHTQKENLKSFLNWLVMAGEMSALRSCTAPVDDRNTVFGIQIGTHRVIFITSSREPDAVLRTTEPPVLTHVCCLTQMYNIKNFSNTCMKVK